MQVHLDRSSYHAGHLLRGIVTCNKNMEWTVCQIHGHVVIDTNELPVPIVNDRTARLSMDGNDTIWDMKDLPDVSTYSKSSGCCIYISTPAVVENGTLEVLLPNTLCPSFQGKGAGVFYVATVSGKDKDSETVLSLNLKFQVIASEFYFRPEQKREFEYTLAWEEKKKDGMYAIKDDENQMPIAVDRGVEPSLTISQTSIHGRYETDVKNTSQVCFYNIGKMDDRLVQLIFYKLHYSPGEAILAVFDFQNTSVPCHQVSAALMLEEIASTMGITPKKLLSSKVVDTFTSSTMHAIRRNMTLCIPVSLPASIETDLVCWKWKICFEFVITQTKSEQSHENAAKQYQTLRWSVPIHVVPHAPPPKTEFHMNPQYFYGAMKST